MTPIDQQREVCASQNIGLYLSNKLHGKHKPWTIFKERGAIRSNSGLSSRQFDVD